MSPIIVQKYGGSSLANLECLRRVAAHVAESSQASNLVVVVSAMGGFTDDALNLARKLHSTPPKRELDMLLTTGERASAALLAIALDGLGVKSLSLTGSQCGILTDPNHGNAKIIAITGERLRDALKNYPVVIVAGFQGVNPELKDITTLGRGGSDLTAVALAHTLGASLCEIYTDVDGIYTCDPSCVPSARKIENLTWDDASQMAWAGAGIMHHRAAQLARKYQVPYRVRSSFHLHTLGTKVFSMKTTGMESAKVTGIAIKEEQVFVRFECASLMHVTQLLQWLWVAEDSPGVCHQNKTTLEVVIHKKSFESLRTSPFFAKVKNSDEGLVLVTIVGNGFRQSPEVLGQILAIPGIENDVSYLEFHDEQILLGIQENRGNPILGTLHQMFLESSKSSS